MSNKNTKQDPFNFAPKIKEMFEKKDEKINYLYQLISNLDGALSSYIEYKNDSEEFKSWIVEKIKKQQEEMEIDKGSEESRNSSGGNGNTKTAKSTTKKPNKKTKK